MSNVQPERQPETPPNTTFPAEPQPAKTPAPDAVDAEDPVDESKLTAKERTIAAHVAKGKRSSK